MTIYKKAQLIQNEQGLKGQLKRVRREGELSAYVSVLSQIHEDMKIREPEALESVVSQEAGPAFTRDVMALINNIGIQNFLGSNFVSISDSLYSLWKEVHAPEAPATPEGQVPGVAEQPAVTALDLLGLTPEDRRAYFMSLTYPEDMRGLAEVIINNFSLFEPVLTNLDSPSYAKKEAQRELVNAMSTLLRWSRGEIRLFRTGDSAGRRCARSDPHGA